MARRSGIRRPGPRTVFWIGVVGVWAVCLAAGGVWIRYHPQTAPAAHPPPVQGCLTAAEKQDMRGFIARRALAVNHLVRPDDVDWSQPAAGAQQDDLLSRYVTCAVAAGERAIAGETAPRATIATPSGQVSLPFPLDGNPAAAAAINAGWTIDVFNGTTAVVRSAAVLAVECRSGTTVDCAAIVAVAPDDAPRLAAANPSTARIVITTKP